jgi:hypothetical protein
LSPMDRAKKNRWSEKIAQEIASRCLRWTENGAFLDIQRAAAIVRAGVTEREQKPDAECERCGVGFRLPSGRCDHCEHFFES